MVRVENVMKIAQTKDVEAIGELFHDNTQRQMPPN